jgi:hypothetical protein
VNTSLSFRIIEFSDGKITIADEGCLPHKKHEVESLLLACQAYLARTDEDINQEYRQTLCEVYPHKAARLGYLPLSELPEAKNKKKKISGYIYLLFDETIEVYKIGLTKDLKNRVRGIQAQSCSRISLVKSVFTDDTFGNESRIHSMFENKRVQGEWFKLTDSEVDLVKEQMDQVAIGGVKC